MEYPRQETSKPSAVPQIPTNRMPARTETHLAHFARCQLCLLMPFLQDAVPVRPVVVVPLGYELWEVLRLQLSFGRALPLLLSFTCWLFVAAAGNFIITKK